MNSSLFRVFRAWLPVAIVVLVLSGLVHVAVQQSIRIGANDPQIQLAEDAAKLLASGVKAAQIAPSVSVIMESSLAVYAIIFDEQGKPIATTVSLAGKTPVPPSDVFDSTRTSGQNRFTWEPTPGVREAAVITHVSPDKGFILVGRSLREVEQREKNLTFQTLVGVIAGLVLSFASTWYFARRPTV